MSLRAVILTFVAAAISVSLIAGSILSNELVVRDHRLSFVKIFVPAGRPDVWPRTAQELAPPIDLKEFERLLEQSGTIGEAAPPQTSLLEKAEYSASYDAGSLNKGTGIWRVRRSSGEINLLSLGMCSMAISQTSAENGDAVPLGLSAKGQLAALVKSTGDIQFEWAQKGRLESQGSVRFDLRFPPSRSTTLTLLLPQEMKLVVTPGVIAEKAAVSGDRAKWRLEFGGHSEVTLRLFPPGVAQRSPMAAAVQQETRFRIHQKGLEVVSQFQVTASSEPLRQLSFAVDRELQIIDVLFDDAPVEWTVDIDEKNMQQLFISPLHPLQPDKKHTVRLIGLAEATLGKDWALPSIAMNEALWSSGTTQIVVEQPLQLQRINPESAGQTGLVTTTTPPARRELQFQLYRSDAKFNLMVDMPSPSPSMTSATSWIISPEGAQARMTVDVNSSERALRELEAELAPGWTIRNIEAQVVNAGASISIPTTWSVEEDGTTSSKLHVRLGEMLLHDQTLRLSILAVFAGRFGQVPVLFSEMQFVKFEGLQSRSALGALSAVTPHSIQLLGDAALERIDPAKLSAEDAKRLSPPTGAICFRLSTGAVPLRIRLSSDTPRLQAVIVADVMVGRSSLSELYEIECIPESASIEKVLVHFSEVRDTPLNWTLSGEDGDVELTAERVAEGDASLPFLPTRGEVWRVDLAKRFATPFKLRAARRVEWEDNKPRAISLASLMEATSQDATISLKSSRGFVLKIENRRLKVVPANELNSDHPATIWGLWRYQPADEIAATDAPLTISRLASAQPMVWAWSMILETRLGFNGKGEHVATWQLENTSGGNVNIKLPAGIVARRTLINGREISASRTSSDEIAITLPENETYPRLSLEFTSTEPRLGWLTSITPRVPSLSVPVASTQWKVHLPKEFASASNVSIGERLFGPLYQERESFGNKSDGAGTRWSTDARRLLQHLEQFDGNWGDALVAYTLLSAQGGNSRVPLFVDVAALRSMGIGPRTMLPANGNEAGVRTGRLEQANLLLVAGPRLVLLTTAEMLAADEGSLEFASQGNLVWIQDEAFQNRLWHKAETAVDFLTPEMWLLEENNLTALPNSAALHEDHVGAICWGTFNVPLDGENSPTLKVFQPSVSWAWGWAFFLLALALSWCVSERVARNLPWAVLIAAILALVLPTPYVPIATGTLLGGMLALLLRAVYQLLQQKRPRVVQTDELSGRLAVTGVIAGLLVSALALAQSVIADDVVDNGAKKAGVYQVLVLVDEQDIPTGTCYLPKEFYAKLVAKAKVSPLDWLLLKSDMKLRLRREETTGLLNAETLQIDFDIEVYETSQRVRIPFARQGLNLVEEWITLDDSPIDCEWPSDATVLELPPMEKGSHHLRLILRPETASSGDQISLDLMVPEHPTATIQVDTPQDSGVVSVASAIGGATAVTEVEDENDGQLRRMVNVLLGPASRVEVKWGAQREANLKPSTTNTHELLWLSQKPEGMRLDARFIVDVTEGALAHLDLAAGDKLELISSQPTLKNVTSSNDSAGATRYRFELGSATSERVKVDASFRMPQVSPLGQVTVPRLSAQLPGFKKRWLAVSAAPNCQASFDESYQRISSKSFAKIWGELAVEPTVIVELSDDAMPVHFVAEPQRKIAEAEQQLFTSFTREQTFIVLQCEISRVLPGQMQYRLHAPPSLEIDSIEVHDIEAGLAKGSSRQAWWTQETNGVINVFLTAPSSAQQRLTLEGRVQHGKLARISVPLVHLLDVKDKSFRLDLLRQPSVLLSVQKAPGWTKIDSPESLPRNVLGRKVATFVKNIDSSNLNSPWTMPQVDVRGNRPNQECVQVTSLERHGDAWDVHVDYRAKISEGVVDQVRFDVPKTWADEVTVEPTMAIQIVDVAGENRRQLILEPPTAVSGDFQFRITARMAIRSGDPIRVPDVRPRDVNRVQRFVVIPRRFEAQGIGWETDRLQPAVGAAELANFQINAEQNFVFQVLGDPFLASLKSVRRVAGVPQIRLADVLVALGGAGDYHGLATFDLEPAGLTSCRLRMPPRSKLLQVRVSGLPGRIKVDGNETWRVELGPERLPQRLEVVYQAKLLPSALTNKLTLHAPMLLEFPVERTLWTVRGTPRGEWLRAEEDGVESSSINQELFRLRTLTEMMKLPRYLRVESTQPELQSWFSLWQLRWQESRARVARLQLGGIAIGQDQTVITDLSAIDSDHVQIVDELGMHEIVDQVKEMSTSPINSAQIWSTTTDGSGQLVQFMKKGSYESLAIVPQATSDESIRRWTLAILLAMMGGVGAYARWKKFDVGDWPLVCGRTIGVLIGLGWALWLTPSVIGWLIVFVMLWPRSVTQQRVSLTSTESTVHFQRI